jgi:hypothetical protein
VTQSDHSPVAWPAKRSTRGLALTSSSFANSGVEIVDRFSRRPCRKEDTEPVDEFKRRIPGLLDGRNLRKQCASLPVAASARAFPAVPQQSRRSSVFAFSNWARIGLAAAICQHFGFFLELLHDFRAPVGADSFTQVRDACKMQCQLGSNDEGKT